MCRAGARNAPIVPEERRGRGILPGRLASRRGESDADAPQGRAREGSDQLDGDGPAVGFEGLNRCFPGGRSVLAAQVLDEENGSDHAEEEPEGQAEEPADDAANPSPHERGLGDSRLVHAAGWDHVFQDRSKDQDERHDGEDDPRGARAGHPRPHQDRAPDEGSGGPNLHDRADHSDEDDDANNDGSKDAHGAIIRAGLTTIKKAATNVDYLCYFWWM